MDLDIAVIGMAVMGQNLALNFTDNNYQVGVYNRSPEKTRSFIASNSDNPNIVAFENLEPLVLRLKKPRTLLLMIKAGPVVDAFIQEILPLLEKGDIVIDGGNSHYEDTIRRYNELEPLGIEFIGAGVSGGEEGARYGPSIMVGGNQSAWFAVKVMLQNIAAKTESGEVCCNWLGADGAGHFVKMVHNGIEYGDMQLISEIYSIMRYVYGLDTEIISNIFKQWNSGKLSSYLIEITSSILLQKDEKTGNALVDVILDVAEQKGTGRWTAQTALELGIPIPLITVAVFQRSLSSDRKSRLKGMQKFPRFELDPEVFSDQISNILENALFIAKLVSYNQGFHLLKMASSSFHWDLNLGEIALLWRAGCIIRSSFLDEIKEIYSLEPDIDHLLFSTKFIPSVKQGIADLKDLVTLGIKYSVPIPGLMSSLAYLESIRSSNLSTNLIQAQRDYFGAHTFRRNDEDSGESYHFNWYD